MFFICFIDGFDEQPSHLPQTPAARAASLARAAMIFRQNLKKGLMEADSTKEGPLCMDTYRCALSITCRYLRTAHTRLRWMFDCCRIPGPQGLDWSISYGKENDLGDSGHLIVFRNNRVWKVDATDGGRILSTAEFER